MHRLSKRLIVCVLLCSIYCVSPIVAFANEGISTSSDLVSASAVVSASDEGIAEADSNVVAENTDSVDVTAVDSEVVQDSITTSDETYESNENIANDESTNSTTSTDNEPIDETSDVSDDTAELTNDASSTETVSDDTVSIDDKSSVVDIVDDIATSEIVVEDDAEAEDATVDTSTLTDTTAAVTNTADDAPITFETITVGVVTPASATATTKVTTTTSSAANEVATTTTTVTTTTAAATASVLKTTVTTVADTKKATTSKTNLKAQESTDDRIANGTYVIGTVLSNSKVVNVKGNKSKKGTNVEIYEANGSTGQEWTVKFYKTVDGTDYYYILKSGTKLALEVKKSKKSDGTNVQINKKASRSSQLWSIISKGSAYIFISKLRDDLVLTVANGKKKNGTNVEVSTYDALRSQKFYLLNTEPDVAASDTIIEDGTYIVSSAGNSKYAIGVAEESLSDDTNIELKKKNSTSQMQKLYFKNDGSNYYFITVIATGKALAVEDGLLVAGTNISQSTYDADNNAQKWAIRTNSDGTMSLVNKGTALVLEVTGAEYEAGTNIRGYRAVSATSASKKQKFKLSATPILEEGIYTITTFLSTSKVLSIKDDSNASGAKIQIRTDNDLFAQKYQLVKVEGQTDIYRIRTAASGGWITYKTTSNVIQYGSSSTSANDTSTWWKVVWNGSYFSLQSPLTKKKVLSVKGSSKKNGTLVKAYNAKATDSQHFYFTGAELIKKGNYKIASALGTYLGVTNSSTEDGGNIKSYTKSISLKNPEAFVFLVKPKGDYYIIKNINSGLVVDVEEGSTASGANVCQNTYYGYKSQKWIPEIADGGYVTFVNVNSGMVINVSGGISNTVSNIQQYRSNGTDSQKWDLQPAANWVVKGSSYYYYDSNGTLTKWNESVYITYNKIKDLSSGTQYLVSIDSDRTYVNVYLMSDYGWEPYKSFLCSVGRGSRTPKGTFTMQGNRSYSGVNTARTHHEYYVTGYYVNGSKKSYFHSILYKGVSGNTVADGRLGMHISGGCIRLALENAKWIYYNLKKGTTCYSY